MLYFFFLAGTLSIKFMDISSNPKIHTYKNTNIYAVGDSKDKSVITLKGSAVVSDCKTLSSDLFLKVYRHHQYLVVTNAELK